MAGRKWTNGDICLTIANVIGVIVIVMIAAAIGTDRWIMFTVNRDKLSTQQKSISDTGVAALYYHTRQRGMFRECYPGTDTVFLDTADNVVDKNCFLVRLVDNVADASSDYRMKVGLYLAFMVMFIVGEVMLIIAYIIGLLLCIGRLRTTAWYAALLAFTAAFLIALGMALFHGAVYVEKELVKDSLPDRQLSYQSWPPELQLATTTEYKESYIVAWVAFALLLITCFGYLLAARFFHEPKRKLKSAGGGYEGKAYSYPQQQVMYQPDQSQREVIYPPEQPVVYYVS